MQLISAASYYPRGAIAGWTSVKLRAFVQVGRGYTAIHIEAAYAKVGTRSGHAIRAGIEQIRSAEVPRNGSLEQLNACRTEPKVLVWPDAFDVALVHRLHEFEVGVALVGNLWWVSRHPKG